MKFFTHMYMCLMGWLEVKTHKTTE